MLKKTRKYLEIQQEKFNKMDQTFKFHHLGYATKSIDKTLPFFVSIGYSTSIIYTDDIQKVKICLLSNEFGPIIELVEGLDKKKSPVSNYIDKVGVTPYHMCYTVFDIEESIKKMIQQKFVLLFNPVKAIAFSGRKICYLFNQNIGLIELLENEISSI
jgi:methylmalonyl-CoA/ethylmalonyl-CoA epimerase